MLRDFKYPVVVLVNENSASAAEIFAGCLRDYKLAPLVGEHTYGKASVQNVIPIAGGTTAKVTIAHYALPSGDDISRKVDEDGPDVSGGIKTEYEVELSLKPDVSLGDAKTDNQLQKAMEIIRKKNPRAK
jgi:carboxyl-terminal processing protease